MRLLRPPIPHLRCSPYYLYGCASRHGVGALATTPHGLKKE
ncbi:hypothetical protein GGR36_003081 [Niveibacterium umoris]|uniref:Uncharacterized protein n=1 Tax=Niveibacterium umoris TaxID=1193620 RepID=A0A840BKE9_9RHOO|nr:hypothetical protein [Niveibacterium umoris]